MMRAGASAQQLMDRRADYVGLIERLRDTVPRSVPPGMNLRVVSRGDDLLLDIPGVVGRHFPQDANGRYAGHYPPDSDAAIEHLEAHRVGGANFLLFPATSFWWLDYYEGFRQHLDDHYRCVRSDADCILYDLRPTGTGPGDPGDLTDIQAAGRWKQIESLLDALLAPGEAVVVLATVEGGHISFENHPVERMLGKVPTDIGDDAQMPPLGARFLLIPHVSGADLHEAPSATGPLPIGCRLVATHAALCTLVDMRPYDPPLARSMRTATRASRRSPRRVGVPLGKT